MTTPRIFHDLTTFYARPGPFVSYYGPVSADAPGLGDLRDQAGRAGASPEALDAVEARLELPVHGDMQGRAVLAASDGHTLVDIAHEGPDHPVVFVDTLPYVAPLLEWDQWRVPHLLVVASDDVVEQISFVPGAESEVRPLGDDPDAAGVEVARLVREQPVDLVLIGGSAGPAEQMVRRLVGVLPTETEVQNLTADPVGDLAEAAVRAVADKVARSTVATLREFRFLQAHDSAHEGTSATVAALAAGRGDLVLVHDDPTDERRAWFGPRPTDIALRPTSSCPDSGRLVDVVIRAAVLQGIGVRVIPSTGPDGPDENLGLLERDPTVSAGLVDTTARPATP